MAPPSLHARWLGVVPYAEALRLQESLVEARSRGEGTDALLLLEHPPVVTLGRAARREHVLADEERLRSLGIEIFASGRGGDVTYHGPGQLVGYPILALPPGRRDLHRYLRDLEEALIRTAADFGVTAGRVPGLTGVWVTDAGKLAAIGVRVSAGWVTSHGFALNVGPDLSGFRTIVPCGLHGRGVVSLASLTGRTPPLPEVASAVACHLAGILGSELVSCFAGRREPKEPVPRTAKQESATGPASSKPGWLRIRIETGERFRRVRSMMSELGLNTVCTEARCPNVYECWNAGTATFMILGDTCTRSCGFCNVRSGRPGPGVDPEEPAHVAEAVKRLRLRHAVITSVDRDDLSDGGAAHFRDVILAIRERAPGCAVEVLTPDFKGKEGAADVVLDAGPEVFAHNVETVPRLYRTARKGSSYEGSLGLLRHAAERRVRDLPRMRVKSSLMLGLGEVDEEILEVLRDLLVAGVDVVTLGQYLRPTREHLPVARHVTPDEFEAVRRAALEMGFLHVESGPLVRSSYHAERHRPGGESRPELLRLA